MWCSLSSRRPKPGAQPQPPLRGTAGKAVYEGAGEWLHLTQWLGMPRIVNGGLELTADKVDVSRQSGDAFAHGNVKATWTGGRSRNQAARNQSGTGQGSVALGGNGPAHVIAAEAQMNQSTGEATFRGHARLWQQANSVAGAGDRAQPATANTHGAHHRCGDPVRAVLLSPGAPGAGIGAGNTHGQGAAGQRRRETGDALRDSRARRRSQVLRCRAPGRDAWRRGGRGGCGDGNRYVDLRHRGAAA